MIMIFSNGKFSSLVRQVRANCNDLSAHLSFFRSLTPTRFLLFSPYSPTILTSSLMLLFLINYSSLHQQIRSMKVDFSKVSPKQRMQQVSTYNFFLNFFFTAHLNFPKEYPLRPPRMKFISEIWHPNIDQNGDGKFVISKASRMQKFYFIVIQYSIICLFFSLHKHSS